MANITGTTGNDLFEGGTGDTYYGGTGDDTYELWSMDSVVEYAGEGIDTVNAQTSYTLSANVENLVLQGFDHLTGTGNALDNVITGNSGINTIDGGAGADTMIGGAGGDRYIVDNVGDTVIENAGEGHDMIKASVSFSMGANIEEIILQGSGDIDATGNDGNNYFTGNSGANVMTGGLGNDRYYVDSADTVVEAAGEGTQDVVFLSGTTASYTLGDNIEWLSLNDSTGATHAVGNTLNNRLYGNASNNILDGGAGGDMMQGGAGDDTYIVDSANNTAYDSVTENANEGTDLVKASVSYWIADVDVENLTLTGSANIDATGNASANVLTGNAGNNILDGGAGADTMVGGLGNDTYVIDNASDTMTELSGEGTDTVQIGSTHTLSANFENLTLTGSADINATGNASANILTGNSGVNVLTGGAGNDTYYVNNAGDTVTENASEGWDRVNSSVSYTLDANVEQLHLTGNAAIDGTGNALNNWLNGADNSGANVLSGGLGYDSYQIGNGDTVVEDFNSGEVDQVTYYSPNGSYTLTANVEILRLANQSGTSNGTGNVLDNTIYGNNSSNTLDGGTGADSLIGGSGSDTYIIDNVGDTVTENAGEGSDTVKSSISYTLGANFENLTLNGNADIDATGNALDNAIKGNRGANVLSGGLGDDSYTIGAGDSVVEALGEGIDTVNSSVSHRLSANVENLTLTGSANIRATGNAAANTLTGNSGNNVLRGGGGADTMSGGAGNDTLKGGAGADVMIGGAGNDTFIVDSKLDKVVGGAGADKVIAASNFKLGTDTERLVLTDGGNFRGIGNGAKNSISGNSGRNVLKGLGGSDRLNGGGGNDKLIGGTGKDVLKGGGGRDVFAYTSTKDGGDIIKDFNGDKLSFARRNFNGLAKGTLKAQNFVANSSGKAVDKDDFFVFNTKTKTLYFDKNGSRRGGMTKIATFSGRTMINNTDIAMA